MVAALNVAVTATPSMYRVGVKPAAGAAIAKTGLSTLVKLSVLLAPLSVAAVKSGAVNGAAGGAASIWMDSAALRGLSFPAASTSLVVMLCGPFVNGAVGVNVNATGSQVASTKTPSTYSVGVLPAPGAATANAGVEFAVRLSVLLAPKSVAAVMSGADAGALGACVSIVTLSVGLSALSVPARLVKV